MSKVDLDALVLKIRRLESRLAGLNYTLTAELDKRHRHERAKALVALGREHSRSCKLHLDTHPTVGTALGHVLLYGNERNDVRYLSPIEARNLAAETQDIALAAELVCAARAVERESRPRARGVATTPRRPPEVPRQPQLR